MQRPALSSPRTQTVHRRVRYVALTISALAGLLGLLALLDVDTKVKPIARFATFASMLPVNPLQVFSTLIRVMHFMCSLFLARIGHARLESNGWKMARALKERASGIWAPMFSPRLFMCFDAFYSLSTIYLMSVDTLQPISELAKFNAFLSTLETNVFSKLGGPRAARPSNGAVNRGNGTASSRVRRRARPRISNASRDSSIGEAAPAVIQSRARQSENHAGSLETVEDVDVSGNSVETRSSDALPNDHAQYDAEAQSSRLEFFRTWGIWPGQPTPLSNLYSSYAGLDPVLVGESEEDFAGTQSAQTDMGYFRRMAEERMSGRSDTFGQTSEFDYIGFDEAPIVDPPPQYSESESSTEQTLERAQDPETPPDYGAPPTRSTRVINGMPVQPSHLTGEFQSLDSPSGNTTPAVSETENTTHTCPTCNGSGITQREDGHDRSSASGGRGNPRRRRINRSCPRRIRRQPAQSSPRQPL
ncbi:hypothetical protein METSCH_F03160 [Metschnikowia aff. pulcherrima]|uniref:Uncharacterized protein n=1 Tax=Metschnikowia aff. pulcherrima TaxID=2163413 RepID=A0A4P6XU59_9ASCO|nr:hypothetical protein METSCH_F03160 [Metschnikowia aff. pulcherrima]